MKEHEINVGIVEFDAIDTEIKKFLILWDTKIKSGDKLILREADDSGELSGEQIEVKVDYLVRGGKDGIESGYVGLSINKIELDDKLVSKN